jgi:hypothetical protein
MQKISKKIQWKAIASVLLISIVSSCASQSENADSLPPLSESEAALLDETEKAVPVMDEAAVFADLATSPDGFTAETTTAVAASTDSGAPFYNPIGGENLGRVAYTLYGDRKATQNLLDLNPSLKGVSALQTDQKVYFDMDRLNPVPTFLTKDLIDRYPAELAAKIEKAGLAQESVTVGAGETLQEVSQRLYGTTRYWTEIYLLNRESISNYDRVPSGTSLKVYQRGMVSQPSQKTTEAPAKVVSDYSQSKASDFSEQAITQEPAEPIMPQATDSGRPSSAPTEAAPTTQAPVVEAVPADPIPETPSYTPPAETTQPPPVVATKPATVSTGGMFDLSNTANLRRIIYVALILVIGIVAFIMTRSSKKKSFDMLDVTTDTTGTGERPKLGGDVDSHKNIG